MQGQAGTPTPGCDIRKAPAPVDAAAPPDRIGADALTGSKMRRDIPEAPDSTPCAMPNTKAPGKRPELPLRDARGPTPRLPRSPGQSPHGAQKTAQSAKKPAFPE